MEKENETDKEKNIKYIRDTLTLLPESENKVLNIQESKILERKFSLEKIKEFNLVSLFHLYFYHYKCESVNDTNWGCAWRSMQTVLKYKLSLSNQNKDQEISFYNLFMKYGSKEKLIEIFKKMKQEQDNTEMLEKKSLDKEFSPLETDKGEAKGKYSIEMLEKKLLEKEFAPFETDKGWAEPFITQLVLYDFGFKGELLLIDHYCPNNYAPEEVFSTTLDFNSFKEKMKTHFTQKNPAPIILDDSYISISIIGVKFNELNNNIELLIMDPHATDKPEDGLYIIILDESGDCLEIIPNKHVLASLAITFSYNKPWMAYFPK